MSERNYEKMRDASHESKGGYVALVALALTVAGGLYAWGYSNGKNSLEEESVDSRLPEVRDNQQLILHPSYLDRSISLGYTLLTDIDRDGNWDSAEKYHAGFTTGSGFHRIYFKEGFGPARSTDKNVEIVEPEFFRPWE